MSESDVVNGLIDPSPSNKTRMTKDDDIGKLFVGGLSYETTKEGLKEYFSNFGKVVGVDIKFDPLTGRPRGFAFVQFKDQSDADAVVNGGPHILDGRTIDPKYAAPIGKPPHLRVKKIFVGGLKAETSDDHIREYFGKYAPVKEIEYITEHSSNRRRGFCFVSFDSEDTVDTICETQFHNVTGNKVEVKRALPKELQQQQAILKATGRGLIPTLGAIRPGLGITGSGYPYVYSAGLGGGGSAFDHAIYPTTILPGYPGYSGIPAGYPAAAAAAAATFEFGTYPVTSRNSEVRYAGTKEILATP